MRRISNAALSLMLGVSATAPAQSPRSIARKLEVTPRKEYAAVLTRALTWLTGGAEQNDYVSVGRLANYFGFVRYRVASGRSISRGRIGQQTYTILDESQRDRIETLLDEQWPALEACRKSRVRVNRAIESLLVGEDRDLESVVTLGVDYGQREAALGLAQAQGFAKVASTLTPEQRQSLSDLRQDGGRGKDREARLPRSLKSSLRSRGIHGHRGQELWNLTSRLLTWVTGTPQDNDYDTAGKPSQHFGFVDLRVSTGHGVTRGGLSKELERIFTEEQCARLRAVVTANTEDFKAFFAARAAINRALEHGLAGDPIDSDRVRDGGRAQGEAEARMTWRQAQAFLELRRSLSDEQAQALLALRHRFAIPDDDVSTQRLDAEKLVAAGARTFALCALCHDPRAGVAIGPSLNQLVGRRIASMPGYRYSPAMQQRGVDGESWTRERLHAFLQNPQADTPGTTMGFTGLRSESQRAALIAFLETLDTVEKTATDER